MATNVASIVRLMLVTDDALIAGRDLIALARAAERGGVTAVQLRLKHATPRRQVELARGLVAALEIPVLVNDRPDIAIAAGAAGVHLGPGDLPPRFARRVLRERMLIGASVGSHDETLTAGDADYWGIGPWRATSTKGDAGPALGAEGFAAIARAADLRPCIAIGGVKPEDAAAVLEAGGSGIAVASGILRAADAEAAARAYADALGIRV